MKLELRKLARAGNPQSEARPGPKSKNNIRKCCNDEKEAQQDSGREWRTVFPFLLDTQARRVGFANFPRDQTRNYRLQNAERWVGRREGWGTRAGLGTKPLWT